MPHFFVNDFLVSVARARTRHRLRWNNFVHTRAVEKEKNPARINKQRTRNETHKMKYAISSFRNKCSSFFVVRQNEKKMLSNSL